MARLAGSKVFGNINPEKIGAGKFFTQGKYSSRKNTLGLKGQLSQLKRLGRKDATANLSQKNVQQFYQLLSGRLKAKAKHYSALITRRDKKLIMGAAEKMVKTDPSFTRDDKKDLKSIVDTIRQKQHAQLLRADTATDQDKVGMATNAPSTNSDLKTPSLESLPVSNFPPPVHKKSPVKDTPLDESIEEVTTNQPTTSSSKHIPSSPEIDDKIPKPTEAKDLPID
ncbi:MAG: hypothetical protein V1712_03925 [Patescibacteria group bacterium]